jgi:hypothetical protein
VNSWNPESRAIDLAIAEIKEGFGDRGFIEEGIFSIVGSCVRHDARCLLIQIVVIQKMTVAQNLIHGLAPVAAEHLVIDAYPVRGTIIATMKTRALFSNMAGGETHSNSSIEYQSQAD